MAPISIDENDVSVILALKPLLSPKGQKLVDIIINLIRLLFPNPRNELGIDTEALINLVELLHQEEWQV